MKVVYSEVNYVLSPNPLVPLLLKKFTTGRGTRGFGVERMQDALKTSARGGRLEERLEGRPPEASGDPILTASPGTIGL